MQNPKWLHVHFLKLLLLSLLSLLLLLLLLHYYYYYYYYHYYYHYYYYYYYIIIITLLLLLTIHYRFRFPMFLSVIDTHAVRFLMIVISQSFKTFAILFTISQF